MFHSNFYFVAIKWYFAAESVKNMARLKLISKDKFVSEMKKIYKKRARDIVGQKLDKKFINYCSYNGLSFYLANRSTSYFYETVCRYIVEKRGLWLIL